MGRAPTPTTSVSTTAPPVKSASPTTLRDNFAKSIKKDPEAYPSLKEALFWDAWNRELHSKAHLHDLKNVLDFSYLPATVEENELFELQKRFMYSVFLSKITVADGAHIVKSIPDAGMLRGVGAEIFALTGSCDGCQYNPRENPCFGAG